MAPTEPEAISDAIRLQTPTHFTRSQLSVYKAAGVLPIALLAGEAHVLLGAEPTKTGPKGAFTRLMWKDFGGLREAADADVAATAGREFAEETLGIFAGVTVDADCVRRSTQQMTQQLRQRMLTREVVHELRQGKYHMFVARTAYVDPLMLELATQQNWTTETVRDAEKTKFCWVRLQDLVRACEKVAQQYHLRIPFRALGIRREGTRYMQLHPCFARTMRLAQAAGLPSLVQDMRRESRLQRPWCHQLVASNRRQAKALAEVKAGSDPDRAPAVPAPGHSLSPYLAIAALPGPAAGSAKLDEPAAFCLVTDK